MMDVDGWIERRSRKTLILLGGILAAVLIPAGLLLTFLIWGTGWIQSNLSTKTDVENVKEALQPFSEEQLYNIAVLAAENRSAQDSARYGEQFNSISESIIEPGIKRLNSLEQRVDHLSDMLGVSHDLIEEQNDLARDTKSRVSLLQMQMNQNADGNEKAERAELMRMIRSLATKVDSLSIPPGRRNSPKAHL